MAKIKITAPQQFPTETSVPTADVSTVVLGAKTDGLYQRRPSFLEEKLLATKADVEAVFTGAITTHTHSFANVTDKPTTVSGYGITDAVSTSLGYYIGTTLNTLNRASGAQTLSGVSIDGNASTATTASNTYKLLASANKEHRLGESSSWDSLGFANLTNLHFQGHNQFWIGAGNSSWYTGTATASNHDLLISTMNSDGPYVRGITFAVDSTGAGNSGYRLGRWISGANSATSSLVVDGGFNVTGAATFSSSVTAPTFIGALNGNAATATTAQYVDYLNGRTDNAFYPVLWGADQGVDPVTGTKRTYAFSCNAVNINSSTGTLAATTFQGAGTGLTGTANGLNVGGSANHLPTSYIGGQQLNPQTYFNSNVGLKVAMTAAAGVWSDTLWINGYAGGDVLSMCALHFQRNGTPRAYISTQASNATAYGTQYELLSTYNMSSHVLPLAGGTLTGVFRGNGRVVASGGSGTSYDTSDLEVVSGRTGGPTIGLHWAGVVASVISIESSGRVAIRNNPGTAYEAFVAGAITGSSFNGPGTGLTGTASNLVAGAAGQLQLFVNNSTNTDFYVLFSGNAGVYSSVNVNGGVVYNPSTGKLTAGFFSGAGTGLTGTASGLSIGGNAATANAATNSTQLGGMDSSRFVYGDGSRGRSKDRSNGNANTSDSSNSSGFYFGNTVTGMPDGGWWNWTTVAGEHWGGTDGYGYQQACSFWGDDFRLRRLTSGAWQPWVSIIHSGNIGGQSVAKAAEAANNYFFVRGTSPTIELVDTDQAQSRYIHHNGGSIGFLNAAGGWSYRQADGNAYFTGGVTADGFYANSDMRLKDLVVKANVAEQIESITYTWKDKSKGEVVQVGYSAQEVRQYMPDAVNEDDKGMLSVNYIQVLVAKVATLEKQLKQLQDAN